MKGFLLKLPDLGVGFLVIFWGVPQIPLKNYEGRRAGEERGATWGQLNDLGVMA